MVDLEGNASLAMEGTSDKIQINAMDYAKYKGETMPISSCRLEIAGNADARVYAFGDISIKSSGDSGIYLYGTPKITIEEFLGRSQLVKKED